MAAAHLGTACLKCVDAEPAGRGGGVGVGWVQAPALGGDARSNVALKTWGKGTSHPCLSCLVCAEQHGAPAHPPAGLLPGLSPLFASDQTVRLHATAYIPEQGLSVPGISQGLWRAGAKAGISRHEMSQCDSARGMESALLGEAQQHRAHSCVLPRLLLSSVLAPK